ncbi:reticulophagy regulator 1 [Antennarius striatus]|uniref:reticulophagy regulator 1 n=1 Tax=Antennarius striatus TaxID=241820 RepID=UPI0035AFF078
MARLPVGLTALCGLDGGRSAGGLVMLGGRDTGAVPGSRTRNRTQPGPEPAAGPRGPAPVGPVQWRLRPYRTSALFAAANAVFWLVAYSSLRAYSLTALLLALLVVMVIVRDGVPSLSTGAGFRCSMTASWEVLDPGPSQDPPSGTRPPLSDSLRLFLQETAAFKQQNPGKFCLLVCSVCTFFAVVGRYVPGILISYLLILGVFLCPLISCHEVGLWLELVLQKLDFGLGELLQKIKQNHERKLLASQAERPDIESDLSSMFPQLDSTAYREMSVSDTEASDVTWTDNGTFNLSEGNTPQTENSEDLDKEEPFTGGLPDFPSLDNGMTTNGDDDDDFSFDLSSPQPQRQTTYPPTKDQALGLVDQMVGEVVTAAVTAAIQDRIEAVVGLVALGDPQRSGLPESTRVLELEEESDSEVEDFELLDQSELEQLEGDLNPGQEKTPTRKEQQAKSGEVASSGFFSKLLRHH